MKAILSLFLFALVGCATCARTSSEGNSVLFLGDSITDIHHIGCTKNYWGYLADWFKITPYIYGINGHQMSAIVSQAQKFKQEHPGTKPDWIFIFAGTNDYNANVPLGEWYTISETKVNRNGCEVMVKKRELVMDNNFRGRINQAMAFLREQYPTSRYMLITPIHRGFATFGEKNVQPDERFSNERGLFIDDYVQVVQEAGRVWAASVVDVFSESGLYPLSKGQAELFHNLQTDMLHPSAAGHERIARAIAEKISFER